jgi:hypothetical protein
MKQRNHLLIELFIHHLQNPVTALSPRDIFKERGKKSLV